MHPIPPVYDRNSEILILGSFPSVKSRESGFFYGHPQNRFWKVLSAVCEAPLPVTVPEKRAFLLAHRIALWDVIASCRITGSSDASIRDAVPNDLGPILSEAPVRQIYTTGRPPGGCTSAIPRLLPGGRASVFPPRLPPTRRGAWKSSRRPGAVSEMPAALRSGADAGPLRAVPVFSCAKS